jgi:hypothetical protein
MLASLLGKALVDGAVGAVVAIHLGSRRTDAVGAGVVLGALTPVFAIIAIETRQTGHHGIAGVCGAGVSIVADDRVESLAVSVDAFVRLGADAPVVAELLVVWGVGTRSVRVARIDGAAVAVVAEIIVDDAVTVVVDAVALLQGALVDVGI